MDFNFINEHIPLYVEAAKLTLIMAFWGILLAIISTNKNSDTSPTVVSEFTGPDGSHRTMETGRNHTT